MSEVFQNKKALYHYSPTLFLSVTTRSSAVVSDVTYLDSRSCQNLVGLVITSCCLSKCHKCTMRQRHGDIDVHLNIISDLYTNKTEKFIHNIICSVTHSGS